LHQSKILILGAILAFGLAYIFSNIPINSVTASLEVQNSTETLAYLPYTNQELGIAFEYPSDWKVEEKTSRFDGDADVQVYSGLNSIKYVKDKTGAGDTGFFDLDSMATMAQNALTQDPNKSLVETVDLDKYKIDNKDTATFLIKTEESFGESSFLSLDFATQIFIVDVDNRFDTIMYQDTVTKFDTPESQEKLNHMLNSFRFINSENNNEIDTSENEDE